MLGILLHILKIIGIVLLVVLAVILALILIVLFVPVRYRILTASGPVDSSLENKSFPEAFMRNETNLQIKVSWLLHIFTVHFRIGLEGQTDPDKEPEFDFSGIKEKMFCRIKIFGITILDILHRKPKPAKKRKRPAGNKKRRKEHQTGKETVGIAASTAGTEEISPELEEEDLQGGFLEEMPEDTTEHTEKEEAEQEDEKNAVKRFFKKISDRIKKIFEKITHIKYTVIETFRKAARGKQKADYYMELLTGEKTRSAREKLLKLLKMIWRGVKPSKSRIVFVLGFKDPELMGKVLAAFGMCIPVLGDTVTITPDFEYFRCEIAGDIKGRITMFTFLRAGIKVLTDKEIKRFIKLFTEPQV